MIKQYVSYNLIEKYKNIKSMIQYHESSIYKLQSAAMDRAQIYKEQLNLYDNIPSISDKFKEPSIRYHENQIKGFKSALQDLLLNEDFNEEYAILFLQQQNITSMYLKEDVHFVGDADDGSVHCCLVM